MSSRLAQSLTRPMVIGSFTLTATALEVKGKPDFEEYEAVGTLIKRMHRASGFWLADWLRYGESRSDWNERLSQAVDATGLSEKRLKNVRSVGAIPDDRRHEGLEFGHHEAVAGMDPDDQAAWLAKAEEQGWEVSELRVNIRASQRTLVVSGQATLEGMYRVIYADPQWSKMSIPDLCKLPVASHALPDSVLFLWVTASMMLQNPGPRDVLGAWGFTYKTCMTWDRVLGDAGHYFRIHHEHLVVATRGTCLPDDPTPLPDSVQTIRQSPTHTDKPEEFRRIIQKLYTRGPYLELFGRERHAGWTVFGNDARQWSREKAATE